MHVVALVTLDFCLARLHLVDFYDTGSEDVVLQVHGDTLVTPYLATQVYEDLVLPDYTLAWALRTLSGDGTGWLDYS